MRERTGILLKGERLALARIVDYARWAEEDIRVQNFALAFSPFRQRIPLYLGSIKPKSIELAGELADGVMTGALNSKRYYQQVVYPHLAAGAERSGRDLADVDVASLLVCAVSSDRREAREMARHEIAFYLPFESIRTVFEVNGFQREREAAVAAFRRRDTAGVLRCVTDEMVDVLTIAGRPDECREKLASYRPYVKLPVLLPPSTHLSEAQVRCNTEMVLKTFAR